MKKIFLVLGISGAASLMFFSSALAATFTLSPSAGTMVKGCSKVIDVMINTEGAEASNAAQIYIDHNAAGGESAVISSAGLYGSYGTPGSLPSGRIGIYGYGGTVSGQNQRFARVNLFSNTVGKQFNLTIHFNNEESVTSKIADLQSNNILTAVTNGSYTVVDGYCETAPPYLTNLNPVPDKPNHPVGQNIIFDIRDDSSGVDISSLAVTLRQNNADVPFSISWVKNNPGDDKWYSVTVDPPADLIRELKVDVSVTARDKAGNQMVRAYSFNDLTCAQLGCSGSGVVAQCADGIDNDGDGQTDFPADTGCSSATDNNEWLSTDFVCDQTICDNPSACTYQCNDGIDNDGDGFIDLADPECLNSASNNNEYGAAGCPTCAVCGTTTLVNEPIVGEGELTAADLRFYFTNRSIPARLNSANTLEALSGANLTAGLDVSNAVQSVSGVRLRLSGQERPMFYDNTLKMYLVDMSAPAEVGGYDSAVIVDFSDNSSQIIGFNLSVVPYGLIKARVDNQLEAVVGARASLEQLTPTGEYVEVRSFYTQTGGAYGFTVPNGTFRLRLTADGYRDFTSAGFAVRNNIVNQDIQMIKEINLLDKEVPLSEKLNYVSDVGQEQVIKTLREVNNPVVEKTVERTVVPVAAAAAAAAIVPALSLVNLLSYLRFLFLQPILFLGLRRRKEWGIIYNALNKLPVDLATVRLVDFNTNRVVQSRVTDAQGRYYFFADPGVYRIEVLKGGFVFPTKILQGVKEDTTFLDIYHGEPIHVDEKNTAIVANIPLDPAGAEKTPGRIAWDKRLRALQAFVARLSIFAGLVALIISPTWWVGGLFVLQIALYFLFKRLAMPKIPKNWGIVYDVSDKLPVDKAVARLFTKQFNKLVATAFTDGRGRYAFLVGPNEYYITFEKNGYKKQTSGDIVVKRKEEVVKHDVGMEKELSTPVPNVPESQNIV